jgi:CheY-like chemotaxis protein
MLATLKGARILLAENSLFNQHVVSEFLARVGVVLCIAQNGQEALDILSRDTFDCVLMDIQMPVLDGFDTTRQIRANAALAVLPVIAMTANVTKEYRMRCDAAGMSDFISKPFKPRDFYTTIAKWLPGQVELSESVSMTPVAIKSESGTACDFDLSQLSELCGGNKQKMKAFALKFLASTRQEMVKIEVAIACNDLKAIKALGHHIKGSAGMIGAVTLTNLCSTLEEQGVHGASREEVRNILNQMNAQLDQFSEAANKLV